MQRILIAETPANAEILHDALSGHFDVEVCHAMRHADKYAGEEIHIVLCGLNFDNRRMYELLHFVRADGFSRKLQFFGINTGNGLLTDAVVRVAAESICRMGGDGLIDLCRWRRDLGEQEAFYRLRLQLACLPFESEIFRSGLLRKAC